jgi:hypothetical protein
MPRNVLRSPLRLVCTVKARIGSRLLASLHHSTPPRSEAIAGLPANTDGLIPAKYPQDRAVNLMVFNGEIIGSLPMPTKALSLPDVGEQQDRSGRHPNEIIAKSRHCMHGYHYRE